MEGRLGPPKVVFLGVKLFVEAKRRLSRIFTVKVKDGSIRGHDFHLPRLGLGLPSRLSELRTVERDLVSGYGGIDRAVGVARDTGMADPNRLYTETREKDMG